MDTKLSIAMDALRCPPDDQPISGSAVASAAGCLVPLLLQQPDVLLLNEPTNHLDAESGDWLEQPGQYKGTVLCVTHGRRFLDNNGRMDRELDRGEGIPYGEITSWLDRRASVWPKRRNKKASARRNLIGTGLDSSSPKAGGEKQSQDQQLRKHAFGGTKEKDARLQIPIPNGRLGTRYRAGGEQGVRQKLLMETLFFQLPPNVAWASWAQRRGQDDAVPNGHGRRMDKEALRWERPSRLLRRPEAQDIDSNKTVWEVVSGGNEQIEIVGQLFNSRTREQIQLQRIRPTRNGNVVRGERNGAFGDDLEDEANVLFIGRATNDIDVNTLRALEEGIEDLQVAQWSSATTAISLTASAPISSRLRETAKRIGLKGRTASTKKTGRSDLVTRPQAHQIQETGPRMTLGRPYVGRFAPSPTGRLRLGSMATAVASCLDARAHQGQWLVRIEDLDPPREVPGRPKTFSTHLRLLGCVGMETCCSSERRRVPKR